MSEEYICKVTEIDGVLCYHKCGEIVRCKDCKYSEIKEDGYKGDRFMATDMVCNARYEYTYPDDYCSDGKRRESE